jgi:hypothetical protein
LAQAAGEIIDADAHVIDADAHVIEGGAFVREALSRWPEIVRI